MWFRIKNETGRSEAAKVLTREVGGDWQVRDEKINQWFYIAGSTGDALAMHAQKSKNLDWTDEDPTAARVAKPTKKTASCGCSAPKKMEKFVDWGKLKKTTSKRKRKS